MPIESTSCNGSKITKNRNRRRSSRKRARSREWKTVESDTASHSACTSREEDSINTDNKTGQRNRNTNSEVENTKVGHSSQNKGNRRPSRKNKSRKSEDIGNCDDESEEGNACTQTTKRHQSQLQNSPKSTHIDSSITSGATEVLSWSSPFDFVPFECEEAMVKVLLPRGKRERGMMRNYMFRLKEIKQALRSASGMTLKQALSLRRLHIKNFNPTLTMSRLGLGEDEDIRQSALIFEKCVQDYLDQYSVQYWTEKEQKQRAREDGMEGQMGTPDFLLRNQVMLRKVRVNGTNTITLEERKIHWVEAKMFYGASTIPQGGHGAVSSLVSKMSTYVSSFGEGAIVFMNGCGDALASELNSIGVMVLDCADTVKLGRVVEHQRTWCASRNGQILN